MKKCTNCKIYRDTSCFSKNVTRRDRLQSVCKECYKEISKKYLNKYKYSKDKLKSYNNTYYIKNKSIILNRNKKYKYNNKLKIREYYRKYQHDRLKYDDIFKLKKYLRTSFRKYIKDKYIKDIALYKCIGCSFDSLLIYLNDNKYGFTYANPGIDIDHIIPISTASSKQELYKLYHYSNLQLLPSIYNRYIKGNKIFNNIDFDAWLIKNANYE